MTLWKIKYKISFSYVSIYYINKGVLEEAKRSHHVRREGQEIPTLI